MSILLTEGLPEEWGVYEISADFRNMINVEMLFNDSSIPEHQRTMLVLDNLYPEVPQDIQFALDGVVWFYTRGEVQDDAEKLTEGKRVQKGYDYEQDADYIYASFCTAYGIRLAEVDFMHWWEFLALFKGLPDDTIMKRIIYWRTCDVSKLSKSEKKHVLQMRNLFALKKPEKDRPTLEEINRKTQQYYDARTGRDT